MFVWSRIFLRQRAPQIIRIQRLGHRMSLDICGIELVSIVFIPIPPVGAHFLPCICHQPCDGSTLFHWFRGIAIHGCASTVGRFKLLDKFQEWRKERSCYRSINRSINWSLEVTTREERMKWLSINQLIDRLIPHWRSLGMNKWSR